MSLPPIESLQRLPPELLDHILKFCDKGTLSSFRLVCKSWASYARPLLFDRLIIRPEAYDQHCEEILAQTDTTIIRSIRHIRFEDAGMIHSEYTLHYYQLIVNRLKEKGASQIQSLGLHFFKCSPTDMGSTFLTFLSSSFPNIIELNIWFYQIDLEFVIRFICSFSQLEILGMHFAYDPEETELLLSTFMVESTPSLPKSLKRFHCGNWIDENIVTHFNNWLSSHPPRPVLEISIFTDKLNMRSYSNLCSETLKALLIRFYGHRESLQDCDLSRLQVLERLTLYIGKTPSDFARYRFMLDTLKSANLRRIDLVVEMQSAPLAGDRLWEELDLSLASDKFESGAVEIRLILVAFYDIPFKDAEECARSLLKSCHAQGRLSAVPLRKGTTKACWSIAEEQQVWLVTS